jgi:hypothetical protein
MRLSSLFVAASVSLLAVPACMVVNEHPRHSPPPAATTPAATPPPATPVPPQPAYVDTTPPADPPHEHPKNISAGRPSDLHAGAPEAFWIWHDAGGWHLRTTTETHLHRFTGRVWANKGEVGNVRSTRLELNDRFRRSGNFMTFDFQTQGGEDGFDFQIAESNCASFYLQIDGKPRLDRTYIGASQKNPGGASFRLCHD